jgi:hypothetical protein
VCGGGRRRHGGGPWGAEAAAAHSPPMTRLPRLPRLLSRAGRSRGGGPGAGRRLLLLLLLLLLGVRPCWPSSPRPARCTRACVREVLIRVRVKIMGLIMIRTD